MVSAEDYHTLGRGHMSDDAQKEISTKWRYEIRQTLRDIRLILGGLLAVIVLGGLIWFLPCTSGDSPKTAPETVSEHKTATILTMNDIYRINGIRHGTQGGLARVAHLRHTLEAQGNDVLLLHAGDLLSPSLLSRRYKGAQMVDVMNLLDGSDRFDDRLLVAFGNHEFDDSDCSDPEALIQRVRESQFIWLKGNLDFTRCTVPPGFGLLASAHNLKDYRVITLGGIKFGIFALTIWKPDYGNLIAGGEGDNMDQLDKRYIANAEHMSKLLRDKEHVDYVIGLTHLNAEDDRNILNAKGGPDLIIGGHDHEFMKLKRLNGHVGGYKQTADALDVGIVQFSRTSAGIRHTYKRVKLGEKPKNSGQEYHSEQDALVVSRVDQWITAHELTYCKEKESAFYAYDKAQDRDQKKKEATTRSVINGMCLEDRKGITKTAWELEEKVNRRKETVIGNWLADQMTAAETPPSLQECKNAPKVGMLGSGSLRLNYNLDANYQVTRREIEELFPFPMPILAICTDGATLKKNLENGLSKPGEGRWPHTSGMRITYSPASTDKAAKILKIEALSDKSEIKPGDKVLLYANSYLAADGPDDDYHWNACAGQAETSARKYDWKSCVHDIAAGKIANAAAATIDKNPLELKQWLLDTYSGQEPIGPRADATTGRLVAEKE